MRVHQMYEPKEEEGERKTSNYETTHEYTTFHGVKLESIKMEYDVVPDVGKTVHIEFYDEDGNWHALAFFR